VWEILRDERGAVNGSNSKDREFVVNGGNTIIGRVLDLGTVRSAAAFAGIPVMGDRHRSGELKNTNGDKERLPPAIEVHNHRHLA